MFPMSLFCLATPAVQPGVCSASHSTQVAGLCAIRVWSFTWEPVYSFFACPAQALHGIAITVGERSPVWRDQTAIL